MGYSTDRPVCLSEPHNVDSSDPMADGRDRLHSSKRTHPPTAGRSAETVQSGTMSTFDGKSSVPVASMVIAHDATVPRGGGQ